MQSGEIKTHVFEFMNTGNAKLKIENVTSESHVKLEWPSSEIDPGGIGEIKITYNTRGRSGEEESIINIVCNTKAAVYNARFRAFVQ